MFTLHILGVIFSVITILYTESKAYGWLTGKVDLLNKDFVVRSHKMVWTFLIITWLSGLLMFAGEANYFLHDTAFIVKIIFVILLTINGFIIGNLMKTAWQNSFRELPSSKQKVMYISGALSAVSWIGAIVCAFLM